MNSDIERDSGKIRITLDDLSQIAIPDTSAASGGQPRAYGNIAENSSPVPPEEAGGSILMNGWCYLGLAGLTGAITAWAICEPSYSDGEASSWANYMIFPLMLVLICAGFGIAESVVERSPRKAAIRGLLSLGLGSVLGFVFYFIGNIVFTIGLAILSASGSFSPDSPALWITRGIAWMSFGVAGGVVYGIVGQSGKKCLYGVAGGVLGAGLGGLIFDPISLATGGAGASRAVGMALFGAATGVAMGLVESALKDRWLYVSAGPLAGKQFILYKPLTTVGSDQSCDIYLFKDPAIQPRHATLALHGHRIVLRAAGPVSVQGRPVREAVLESGNSVQIGRYAFQYKDRERATR